MRTRGALALLAGATVLAGCGGGGADKGAPARATLQRYFAAVAAGRPQAACSELTERSQERLAEFAKPLHSGADSCAATMRVVLGTSYGRRLGRLAHPRITRLTVHGASAVAAVDGVDRPLELRHEGATWRIDFTPSVEADKLPGGPKDSGGG